MLFVHGPEVGVGEGEEGETGVLGIGSTDGFGFVVGECGFGGGDRCRRLQTAGLEWCFVGYDCGGGAPASGDFVGAVERRQT